MTRGVNLKGKCAEVRDDGSPRVSSAVAAGSPLLSARTHPVRSHGFVLLTQILTSISGNVKKVKRKLLL